METTLTIQAFLNNKWNDTITYATTKRGVIAELKEDQRHNPNIKFRVIQRVTTVTSQVIYPVTDSAANVIF